MNLQPVKFKKKFGQHFLLDKNIASKIAESLTLSNIKYKTLLEIGPGNGNLTEFLLNKKDIDLYLVEIDNELIQQLRGRFSLPENRIINNDFLKLSIRDLFDQQIGIIGNFPYNISSQILIKVIENKDKIPELIGMFQKEVAERICSLPGNKIYGIISVFVQAFYNVEYLFSVSKNVFRPRPKVESGVIRLVRKDNFSLDCNEKLFFQIVKQAFNQRRKILKNSLEVYRKYFSKIEVEILGRRPEELSVSDFEYLARFFY